MVLSCLLINEGTSMNMPAISEIKQTKRTKQRRQQFSGPGQKAAQDQDARRRRVHKVSPETAPALCLGWIPPLQSRQPVCTHNMIVLMS